MIELVFAALLVLCSARVSWLLLEAADARRERRAACAHENTRRVNAMDDPRFPVLICDDCGHQQMLPQPVPCPHCGGDVNAVNRV